MPGVIGEGEALIGRCLEHGGGEICYDKSADLTSVAFPKNIDKIFPLFYRYRTIGIQTSRGCPHKCIYCTYPLPECNSIRPRPTEVVTEEIAHLRKNFGKNQFFFVDSSFNSDESHMARLLESTIARRLAIRFSCYLQPRIKDYSLFGLLKKSGGIAMDFGTDSDSAAMLQSLRKSFTLDDVWRTSEACRETGIDFCHSLLFGGPDRDT